MQAWLLNVAYFCFLLLVSPVLLYRMVVQGKYREGWQEKFLGRLPPRKSDRPCLWLHAVSVGEVLQLQKVIQKLHASLPRYDCLITTTTHTGRKVAQEKFPDLDVCYYPLDFSWSVRQAIRNINPAAIILVELELWPNFIQEADRMGIPLALINARMSQKSFHGYRRIKAFIKTILRRFTVVAAQNQTYARRLSELGAHTDRLHITGSIKFDQIETNRDNQKTNELRNSFGLQENEILFVAGSTQEPEELYALDTFRKLQSEFPLLRLLLVPRHQERFLQVAKLVEQQGLPILKRSELCKGTTNAADFAVPPVLLLDTLGELSSAWGLADIAFVGGSFTNRGGQNMIEPAAYGAAVFFGPNTWNFQDVVELLLEHNAAQVIGAPGQFTQAIRNALIDPNSARARGLRAQKIVQTQQGATHKTITLLEDMLAFRGHFVPKPNFLTNTKPTAESAEQDRQRPGWK